LIRERERERNEMNGDKLDKKEKPDAILAENKCVNAKEKLRTT
jgi:hypothetical protein